MGSSIPDIVHSGMSGEYLHFVIVKGAHSSYLNRFKFERLLIHEQLCRITRIFVCRNKTGYPFMSMSGSSIIHLGLPQCRSASTLLCPRGHRIHSRGPFDWSKFDRNWTSEYRHCTHEVRASRRYEWPGNDNFIHFWSWCYRNEFSTSLFHKFGKGHNAQNETGTKIFSNPNG